MSTSPAGVLRCRRLRQRHAPRSWKSGGAILRGEFRQRVFVAWNYCRRFETRDRCGIESDATRRDIVRIRAEADFRRAAPAAAPRHAGRRRTSGERRTLLLHQNWKIG
jgi:hypothetical protein